MSNSNYRTKFVFSPTNQINCCNVNSLGFECNIPNPGDDFGATDEFGSLELYQTIFLVLSNLVLLIPAFKAFIIKNYSRVFLNLLAMFISSAYHLCKTSNNNSGGLCFLPFCTLKSLDYAASNTLLISLIFFILPFTIEEFNTGDNIKQDKKEKKLLKKIRFIEDYILLCYFGAIYLILNSTILCSGKKLFLVFIIFIISSLFIAIVGHFIILKIAGKNTYMTYNRTNLFIGFTLAAIAILFFFIEDYMNKKYYWIFHSLWHIIASISQIFLLDARTNTRTGFKSFFFCCSTN